MQVNLFSNSNHSKVITERKKKEKEHKLHQSGKPLQELSNRMFEELQYPVTQYNMVQYPIVAYMKNKISYVQYKSFKIAINKVDNCALLEDNSVVFILDIVQEERELFYRAQCFLNSKSLFTTPYNSERLGIFVISNTTTSSVITVAMTKIKRKCLKIKYPQEADSYVIIPLLHTNN